MRRCKIWINRRFFKVEYYDDNKPPNSGWRQVVIFCGHILLFIWPSI